METLKEKIREQVIELNGSRLDELAKIVAESNNARWKNKMAGQQGCANFKQKLKDFFGKEK